MHSQDKHLDPDSLYIHLHILKVKDLYFSILKIHLSSSFQGKLLAQLERLLIVAN